MTSLRDTAGFTPQDFLGDLTVVELAGVLAIIRASSEALGQARAWGVYEALRRLDNVTINGRRYVMVQAISSPQHLGLDASDVTAAGSDGRRLWSCNFLAWRAR
jgi:hypothetical protein